MIRSKIYLSLLFVILFSLVSMSQAQIGVFTGMNMSKLSGDTPPKAKYKNLMGANIGAFIDIKLTESIYVSFQPSYSQEGTKVFYNVKGIDEPVDSLKMRLNYFSVPIMFKVKSTNEKFYAISGFETGLLLNSSISNSNDKEGEEKGDIESVAQWNLAIHFGAGINIPIGFPSLFIEARYTQGLENLTDEPLKNSVIPRLKTSGLKIMAGIKIPLENTKN